MGSNFLRPIVFFPALLLLVTLSVLLTPHVASDSEGGLTSHSTAPGGVSAFADVAKNFGWTVRRLEQPLSSDLATDAVYAVFVPAQALTVSETHVLLDRVREGASLLILLGRGSLRDSLHLDVGDRDGRVRLGTDSVSCPPQRLTIRAIQRMAYFAASIEPIGPIHYDTTHLAVIASTRNSRARPTIIGLKVGRGRIAAVADGQLFANDAIRVCNWGLGITAMRTLEWLSGRDDGAPIRTLVFDEYHHGYGTHASAMRTMQHWATTTPSGRVTLQIAIAALVLLIAAGVRAIPPLPVLTISRRSPLEHVTALANAYEKVRGTRISTRLLVKGVRRRANRTMGPHVSSEEEFLNNLAQRSPALDQDIARVQRAMSHEITAPEFLEIASTIDRIERSMRT